MLTSPYQCVPRYVVVNLSTSGSYWLIQWCLSKHLLSPCRRTQKQGYPSGRRLTPPRKSRGMTSGPHVCSDLPDPISQQGHRPIQISKPDTWRIPEVWMESSLGLWFLFPPLSCRRPIRVLGCDRHSCTQIASWTRDWGKPWGRWARGHPLLHQKNSNRHATSTTRACVNGRNADTSTNAVCAASMGTQPLNATRGWPRNPLCQPCKHTFCFRYPDQPGCLINFDTCWPRSARWDVVMYSIPKGKDIVPCSWILLGIWSGSWRPPHLYPQEEPSIGWEAPLGGSFQN